MNKWPILDQLDPQEVGVSSWIWGREYYYEGFSLFDVPARAKALRFKTVELNDFMLPPPRYSRIVRPIYWSIPTLPADSWRYRWASLHRLKDRLDQAELTCLCWTINSDFCRPERARFGQAYLRNWGLEAANHLKARYMRFILSGPHQKEPSLALIKRTGRRVADFTRQSLDRFPTLELLIENHWGITTYPRPFVQIYEEACNLLSSAERDRLGICLDPLNLPPSIDRPAAWRQLLPYAKHIHLKQTDTLGESINLQQFIDIANDPSRPRTWVIEDPAILT